MKFDIADLAQTRILSGAPSGRALFNRLITTLPEEPATPQTLLLDFRKVEVATASFLRESVLEFRTYVRGRKSNFYPVVANASRDVLDEIFELVQLRGQVIMTCSTDENGEILRFGHVGKLDHMQQLTFDLVNKLGKATATELMKAEAGAVGATAWNNRLASLSNLGLVFEEAQGRTKIYKPLFFGERDGR